MEFGVGVGLTNACDLACAHCYRDTERVDQLAESQLLDACDALLKTVSACTTAVGRAELLGHRPALPSR